MRSMVLNNLPKLTSFCPGSCFLDFQSLKEISIKRCPSMKTFTSPFSRKRILGFVDKESSRGDRDSLPMPFFFEKVFFPKLEKLTFKHMDSLSFIWPDRLAKESFSQLKKLKVEHCENLQQIFPSASSLCNRLQNFSELVVRSCNGLTRLTTSSQVPKNLNLMVVVGCEKMEEIVSGDSSNDVGGEICLMQLRKVSLLHLPVLVCFSSSQCVILKLPRLLFLGVKDCPRMNTFTHGKGLVTPKLHGVAQIEEDGSEDGDEYRWDGDLNTTIGNILQLDRDVNFNTI